jgi:hypothetical protein
VSERDEGFCFSEDTDKIFPAFMEVQAEIDFATKNSNNPFFDSKYADLKEVWAVIKEPLKKHKLLVMQFPTPQPFVEVQFKEMILKQYTGRNGPYDKLVWNGKYNMVKVREMLLTTQIIHPESGQWIKHWYVSTPEGNGEQANGKCITYSRRYTLMPIFGICPEDSDGNPTPKTTTAATTQAAGSKEKPKANPKDIFYDVKKRARYQKSSKMLNDKLQKELGCIDTATWGQIQSLITSKLGGNIAAFNKWLYSMSNVNWYDIKLDMVRDIIQTLKDDPEKIINPAKNED